MAARKTQAKGLTASQGRMTVYLDPAWRKALRLECVRQEKSAGQVIQWLMAKTGVKPEPAKKRRA